MTLAGKKDEVAVVAAPNHYIIELKLLSVQSSSFLTPWKGKVATGSRERQTCN